MQGKKMPMPRAQRTNIKSRHRIIVPLRLFAYIKRFASNGCGFSRPNRWNATAQ